MTFGRLAKLLAVLLIGFALWQARPPAPPARVVVLALPGAPIDLLAPAGEIRSGEIRVEEPAAGARFWRHLFFEGEGAGATALWSGERAAARVLAVPARLLPALAAAERVETAFLGSSSGAVVEAADLTTGRLPAPYDRAIDSVSASVSTLRRDQWSEWISVRPAPGADSPAAPPTAEFQFAHYTDTTYFFSPAYVVGPPEIVASPFLRGLDRELRPIVSAHVIELSRRRLATSRDLFRTATGSRPAIVFSAAAEDAMAVFSPDSTPSSVLDRIRDAIAAEIATLREAVGSDGLVVVVGGPSTTRQAGESPWYRILEGGRGGKAGQGRAASPLELAAARALVRYVVGVSLDVTEKALLPGDVVARFPVRATVAPTTAARETDPPGQDWSATALESLSGGPGGRN